MAGLSERPPAAVSKSPFGPPIPQQPCPQCLGDTRPPLCPTCGDAGEIKADEDCSCCGRIIDAITEAAYSCDAEHEWHCADCHFAEPHVLAQP